MHVIILVAAFVLDVEIPRHSVIVLRRLKALELEAGLEIASFVFQLSEFVQALL